MTEVFDIISVCQTFPDLSQPQLERDHILNSIDNVFMGETRIIIVEGSGLGRTNILAQFSARHHKRVVMTFVRPTSRWGYDRDFIRFDLANQLQWLLSGNEVGSIEVVDDAFLRYRWIELNRKIRRTKDQFFVVIDGIGDLIKENESTLKIILDLLPFEFSGFRFLLSGDAYTLAPFLPRGIQYKSYPLPHFTLDETVQYFASLDVDRHSITEIHRTCRGYPGHLASIRRIIGSGINVHDFVANMPEQLPELFQIEWRKVDTTNATLLRLVALIAHDQRQHLVDDLARILHLPVQEVRDFLVPLTFISIDANTQVVEFVSDAYRYFAAQQLAYLKKNSIDLQIDDLLHTPESTDALNALPGYLEQAERFDDLLTYLSPEHLAQMLERSQSLGIVKDKAALGVRAAARLHRDYDLVRFSMQRSALTELAGAGNWRAEVLARMAVHEYEATLALAQNIKSRDERLHLLAVIARTRREQGLALDQELSEQIHHLIGQIDPSSLDDMAVEIAADLIYTHPELAINLVEKSALTDTGENALDWAFAELSIRTSNASISNAPSPESLEDVASRIKDPIVKRFTAEAARSLKDYSAPQVIIEVEQLDKPIDGLYLLRQWTTVNRKRSDAAVVVDYALKLAIRTTPYVPNARDLRQLAAPLPFIDVNALPSLVKSFEGQQGTIIEIGPTEDYVRLWLLLAEAEIQFNFEAARNKIVDIYLYVSDLDDLAVKTSCIAWIVAALTNIDPNQRLEQLDNIHSLTENDLRLYLQQLLDVSADHNVATQSIITALAQQKPQMAFDLTQALNVAPRRDYALRDMVSVMLRADIKAIDFSLILRAVSSFDDPITKDETVLNIFDRLSRAKYPLSGPITGILSLIDVLHDVHDAKEKCRGYSIAYAILLQQDPVAYKGLAEQLLERLNVTWRGIDVGWQKLEVGFEVASQIAPTSKDVAKTYISEVEQARSNMLLDAGPTVRSYICSIKLALRAYSGLLPNRHDTSSDFDAIANVIDCVPSSGERAAIWAQLAMHYYLNNRREECQRVVSLHVKPLLDNIDSNDSQYKAEVVSIVAPALYVTHEATAFERIEALPLAYKDAAYWTVCVFLLFKKLPTDPFDIRTNHVFDVTYDGVVDLCELLGRIDIDLYIYYGIEWIVDTVSSSRSRNRFSRQQQISIADRLDSIIQSKLPNPRYIQHNGWKVAAEAQLARIVPSKGDAWAKHLTAARNLPNLADRLLVLTMVAVAMPSKQDSRRAEIFEEVARGIDKIPMSLDRIGRLDSLANHAMDSHPDLSSKYLRRAMKMTLAAESPESFVHQRHLIDIAYRHDPDLAASLASMADNDPARQNVQKHLKQLRLKQEMVGRTFNSIDIEDKSDFVDLAWKLLGALNSKRVPPITLDRTRKFVEVAATLPLTEAYPIMAWVIQNAVERFARSDQAITFLRPLFEAALLGTELAGRVAARSSGRHITTMRNANQATSDNRIVFGAGDRDRAVEHLRQWFDKQVGTYLIICDAYFGPEELEILKLLNSVKPNCSVKVLTSQKVHDQQGIIQPVEAYREQWRRISDVEPPDAEIVIVGLASNRKSPIHDRWWISDKAGLSVGTSFNSLGITQQSAITSLSETQLLEVEEEINRYLVARKREYNGEKLDYATLTL